MALDTATQRLVRVKLLGWGVAASQIFPGLDVGRDVTFSGGDLAVVSGMDNLGQDLTVALTTALGADPFNVNFGFDGVNALVEEQSAMIARERIRVSIIKLLNSDPRVRRILDVKLLDGRLDPLSSDLGTGQDTATLRVLDVRVAFETVTGDQSTLDLGGVKLNG
jgi:phage baseplate assembly protein W